MRDLASPSNLHPSALRRPPRSYIPTLSPPSIYPAQFHPRSNGALKNPISFSAPVVSDSHSNLICMHDNEQCAKSLVVSNTRCALQENGHSAFRNATHASRHIKQKMPSPAKRLGIAEPITLSPKNHLRGKYDTHVCIDGKGRKQVRTQERKKNSTRNETDIITLGRAGVCVCVCV